MANLIFKIVTPERVVFESVIAQATLPTQMGEITILPNHIPLMSTVVPGEIVIKTHDGTQESLAVSGGLAQIAGNAITILADTAEMAQEISETKAEEAHRRAWELLEAKEGTRDRDYAALKIVMDREFARLKVARKYKERRHSRV